MKNKFLFLLCLLALLLSTMPVFAQSPIDYDSVFVSIWPEFDNQQALVIYKLALSPKTTVPTEVILRVPSTVERLWTVAVGDSFDTVSDAGVDYQFKTGQNFSTITLTAKSRYIQIEYYDVIKKNNNSREYTYQWNGDGTIGTFEFELRQPLKSENLVIAPSLAAAITDDQGFAISSDKKVDVQAGERIIYKFTYDRSTDDPSTSFMQVQPSTQQPVTSQQWVLDYLPAILGGLGLIFLIVAGFLYYTSGRSHSQFDSRRRHPSRSTSDENETNTEMSTTHCPECGKRSHPGDKFCRTCGAKLK